MRNLTKLAFAAGIALGLGTMTAAPAEAFSKDNCHKYRTVKVKAAKDPFLWVWYVTDASGKKIWYGVQCKWW